MQVAETGGEVDDGTARFARYKYPAMAKTLGNFSLHVRIAPTHVHRPGSHMHLLPHLLL